MNKFMLLALVSFSSFCGCKSKTSMPSKINKISLKENKKLYAVNSCLQSEGQVVKIIAVEGNDYKLSFVDELNRTFLQDITMTNRHFEVSLCEQTSPRQLEPTVFPHND